MLIRCPACGAEASLDALLGAGEEREAASAALARAFALSGDLGRSLVRYLALFRPDRRELGMKRVAALLGEILPAIEAGRIERAGRQWAAPQAAWIAAIEQMWGGRAKLRLPLKGHGYLYEILAGAANRGEAQAEAKVEETRRYNPAAGRAPSGQSNAPERAMPDHIREHLRHFVRRHQDTHDDETDGQ